MPKPAVKPVSSSQGLTFEECRELVGKLRNVSDILARELTQHSGARRRKSCQENVTICRSQLWDSGVKAP